jgi:SAM-dependent methyltransferase
MSGVTEIQATVKEKYREAALRVVAGQPASCGCGCGTSETGGPDPITSNLYSEGEAAMVGDAVAASLGCGNPTALAELRPGERVLDLGSGGGIDVLLSARRVGPTGKAYGLDMTDEMLALAIANRAKAGIENAEFLKGHIEQIPLPANSVDVIISNCVINLSGDKRQVISEAFRVLAPGGRFAVTDVVTRGDLPPEVRSSLDLWAGCVAGALSDTEFRSLLEEAGFTNVEIEPVREYDTQHAVAILNSGGLDGERLASQLEGRLISAFVRARKAENGERRTENREPGKENGQ